MLSRDLVMQFTHSYLLPLPLVRGQTSAKRAGRQEGNMVVKGRGQGKSGTHEDEPMSVSHCL